jgi:hypothetical protein
MRAMKSTALTILVLGLLLGSLSPADARRVRGQCTNARTGYHHSLIFIGRLNTAAGQLRGRVVAAGRCPRGRLVATCVPTGNFYDCQGTVGRCQIEGPYYGMFPATYTCPDGTVGAYGW